MFLRSLAVLTLTSTFALAGCGDDKNDETSLTTNNTPSGATPASGDPSGDPSGEPTTGGTGGTESDATTNIMTGNSMSEATSSTTTNNPSEVTTTQTDTTTPPDTSATDPSETGPVDTSASETGPADTGSSDTGGGGDFYGPCEMADPPCPAGSDCLMIEGLDGNFCSPTCEGGTMCPANPEGSAMAQCALTMMGSMDPVNCALVCQFPDPGGSCPTGTSCKQLPAPNDSLGLCTAP
ncbi:MAG: hypothetical protein JNL82_26580 [Myxococcales bacterium]|nr:hypothetical protein [Myxococcales bacterium]